MGPIKLKPCPHCGHRRIVPAGFEGKGRVQMECYDCGMLGPHVLPGYTYDDGRAYPCTRKAEELWNSLPRRKKGTP